MDVSPFGLERWFAEYEHDADIMLAESGIRSLPADRFDLDPGKLGYVIPTNGDPEFRADVGARYGRSADEVLFTVGTQEANFLTFLSLLNSEHGDHAVVVTPTYQALHAVPEAFGEVTGVPLHREDWSVDVEGVKEAIRDDTAVVVLNNPNNPTGNYHDEATVRELYDLAAEHDAALGEQEDDILTENRALATEHREIVADWLDEHGLDWHEPVGVNGFVTVPDGFADAEEFCRVVVEEASVVLAPGHLFGPYEDRFRIGFGLPTAELREGLERVGDVIRNH